MKLGLTHVAILILSITAIKLALPPKAPEPEAGTALSVLKMEQLADFAMSVGRGLAGVNAPIYVSKMEEDGTKPSATPKLKTEFPLEDMVEQNLKGFKAQAETKPSLLATVSEANGGFPLVEIPSAVPEALPPATPAPSPETNPKVDAFLQAQAAFAQYSLPEKVSYDYPVLPFEYGSPGDGRASSGFGYRMHPIQNTVRFHYGTDIARNEGDDIYAFANGTVLSASEISGYGLTVMLDHGNGYTSLYAHCSSTVAKVGEWVAKGQLIAKAGQTGNVTGPHLHFELMCNGIYYNPEFYV